MPDKGNFGAVLQPVGFCWQNNDLGLKQDSVTAALRSSAGTSGFHEMNHPVVVQQPVAFTQNQREEVREVEVPGALAAEPGTHQQTYVAQPVPYDLFQITAPVNRQNRKPGDPCHTLARDNAAHAAVVAVDLYNQTIDGDCAATLTEACGGTNTSGPKVMAFDWQKGNDVNNPRPSTMNVAVEHSQTIGTTRTPAVAFQACGDRDNPSISVSDTAFCLPANAMSDRGQAVAFSSNMSVPDCQTDGTTPTMKCGGQGPTGNPPAVAHALRGEGFDASEDGTGRGTPLVPHAMTVRRLTPRECERLQGFPDDWTLIPWRKKPAEECPDGPRYKALGNSMAVNCMAWIGERIAAAEASHA